ncbi:5-methylcytosine rRNA methyltransferase NSUN4 isoform X2 [Anabrus simplex]|uniref:5-methylcytosine rRNA methyltransferase NSUN4 isoform X2 n=1 Tax=Anabrus simplex TaxID=316456 RepID=UPI0035A3AADF
MFGSGSSCNYLRPLRLFTTQVRCRHKKERMADLAKKKFPKDKALEHFDDFYKNVYGPKWPSIRLALLSPHKYCAIVNNFGDSEQTVMDLQNQGALNLRTLYELEESSLKEKEDSENRSEDLEKIFKLDQKMEMIKHSKQIHEYESLYPADENNFRSLDPDSSEERAHSKEANVGSSVPVDQTSLKHSIDNAEIDESRIINPDIGLSSASLYEFVPATKLKGMEDWVLESQHYGFYKRSSDFPVNIKKEDFLHFPKNLEMFIFERGNVSTFPSPKRGSTGVLNYYLMDGGSVLPVLALGLEPGDAVLDMCAAPGGKSLAMLQTLYPGQLVCNDIQESRTNRIYSVFKQYLYDVDKWREQLFITQNDGRTIQDQNLYHKILVDVPCTTDRHSVHENDNNIFKQTRTKERLMIPELQAGLLSHFIVDDNFPLCISADPRQESR